MSVNHTGARGLISAKLAIGWESAVFVYLTRNSSPTSVPKLVCACRQCVMTAPSAVLVPFRVALKTHDHAVAGKGEGELEDRKLLV